VNGAQQHLKLAVEAKDEQRRIGRLGRAHEVLIRAITENNQGDNPGAWYYLGRYYVELADPWGADSAFDKVVALAPQCTDDVREHLGRLYPEVRTGVHGRKARSIPPSCSSGWVNRSIPRMRSSHSSWP
jgi:tetratricopeptide (TPR) repeat protein